MQFSPYEQQDLDRYYTKAINEFKLKLKMKRNKTESGISLIRLLHEKVDKLAKNVSRAGIVLACSRGCSSCCKIRVEALTPEIFYMADQLKRRSGVDKIITQLEKYSKVAKGLKMDEHRLECPMLHDNECSIYDIRPMMCRRFHSLSIQACRTEGADIPQNGELACKAMALPKALKKTYADIGLSVGQHELGQALLVALTKDSALKEWSEGEVPFDLIPEEEGN